MRRLTTLFVAAAVAAGGGGSEVARAQESHLHAGLAVGHAVGDPQQSELGFGGHVGLTYELRFGKIVGGEIALDGYDLSQQHGQGFGADGLLGLRLRPFGESAPAGLWLDVAGGAGVAESVLRPVFEGRIGYDLVRLVDPSWEMGPFVGYMQVFQESGTVQQEDAHVLWVGFHVDLAARETPQEHLEGAREGDRDGDGVLDDEDACPRARGFRTNDPKTNGCPKPPPIVDRDADNIPDDVDACDDVPGIETSETTTNGCPPEPHGMEAYVPYVGEDACPDIPGHQTADPKKKGCPITSDRDRDGVLDVNDACPDVPGVHTADRKTNGCPVATDQVRVEGDQILLGEVIHFETGSAHVHHVSWGIVKKIAQFMQQTPDIEQVEIQGNADEVGSSQFNLALSKERAASVKRLLVHFGVDPGKLVEHAYGEDHPREAGHDETAHRENRRVEFTITRARTGTAPAQPLSPIEEPSERP